MKIIKKLLQAVKPGDSKRNTLKRGIPRKLTPFEQSVAELQSHFAIPQNSAPVPTWSDSLKWLQAAAYA